MKTPITIPAIFFILIQIMVKSYIIIIWVEHFELPYFLFWITQTFWYIIYCPFRQPCRYTGAWALIDLCVVVRNISFQFYMEFVLKKFISC